MDDNILNQDFIIIGDSQKIKDILEVADRVAVSDASVLIYGESGTGKEVLARYIYKKSRRNTKKFVAINCAAIPANLLENELFGHKKGAFTDAVSDYTGIFGHADHGTIFLDEIAEMSIDLQAKLLRILQFMEYQPIGSAETLKTDVRIIAATNKNLKEMITQKKMREDLFYRLNVVPIVLPPLRERENDTVILAEYFLKLYASKNNKNLSGFSAQVIDSFKTYDWPGNIRELQNVIERAVVLCNENYIRKIDLLNDKFDFQNEYVNTKGLKQTVFEFKKTFIIHCLEKNSWNQTKTAKELKVQRTYLARLIKELKINKL